MKHFDLLLENLIVVTGTSGTIKQAISALNKEAQNTYVPSRPVVGTYVRTYACEEICSGLMCSLCSSDRQSVSLGLATFNCPCKMHAN